MRSGRWLLFFLAVAVLLMNGTASAYVRSDRAAIPSSPFSTFLEEATYPLGEGSFTSEMQIGLYASGDPINQCDPDGRVTSGYAGGWNGEVGASASMSMTYQAASMIGSFHSGELSGLWRGTQDTSGYTSYQENLSMFDGNAVAAASATWNPINIGARGLVEGLGGTGLRPNNLGSDLNWVGRTIGVAEVFPAVLGAGYLAGGGAQFTVNGITALRNTYSTSQFASERGALTISNPFQAAKAPSNFATEAKLQGHFEQHGAEFGAKSATEYLQVGKDIIQQGYKVEYIYNGGTRNGFVQFMGNTASGKAKFGFVGTNSEGAITTIHVESGNSFWKMLNGNPLDKTIYPTP